MSRTRYAPARIGQSKLTQVTAANRNVIDHASVIHNENIRAGSKALCAAIIRSGKWHRPMTAEEEINAIGYAFGVKLIGKIK